MSRGEIKSVNGVDLFVETQGGGKPVVLLGGPGLGHYYMEPLAAELAKDFQVVTYDQRGCGQSSDVPAEQITAAAHLEDLDGLRRALGIERLNLVGHSLGGLQALVYAARHADSMGSLVLAGAAPPFTPELMEQFETRFGGARKPDDAARLSSIRKSESFRAREPGAVEQYFRVLYLPFFVDPATASSFDLHFTGTSAKHVVEAEEMIIPQIFEMEPGERLREITCPTLVLQAKRDVVPPEFAEMLAGGIRGAELAILPEAGHFAFLEDPAAFFSPVVPFLQKEAR